MDDRTPLTPTEAHSGAFALQFLTGENWQMRYLTHPRYHDEIPAIICVLETDDIPPRLHIPHVITRRGELRAALAERD